MKLIDVLVGKGDGMELFGVHTKYLAMDPDGRVYGYTEIPTPGVIGWSVPGNSYSTDGRGCLIQIDRDDIDGQWQSAIITREQYEAALAAKNDGWIEWGGGKCPVEKGKLIDVKWRDGKVDTAIPAKIKLPSRDRQAIIWHHSGYELDIIAYRLHQPQEAEQAEADDETYLNECIGQTPAPVWSGEGLPPVGCECEWQDKNTKQWNPVKVVYASEWVTVIREINKEKGDDLVEIAIENYGDDARLKFRPIRSEADIKRHDAAQALCYAGGGIGKVDESAGIGSCWFDVYDAIAAGKIPGVKLED